MAALQRTRRVFGQVWTSQQTVRKMGIGSSVAADMRGKKLHPGLAKRHFVPYLFVGKNYFIVNSATFCDTKKIKSSCGCCAVWLVAREPHCRALEGIVFAGHVTSGAHNWSI